MNFKNIADRLNSKGLTYLPFKLLEGLIGILSLSLYTSFFHTADYGNFVIINSSAVLIGLLSIGWLRFVVIRYVKPYSFSVEDRTTFYSTMVFSYILVLIPGLVIFTFIIYQINPTNKAILLPIYYAFYIGYTLNQLFLDLLLFTDKLKLNVILILLIAITKPSLVMLMFVFKFDPVLAFLLSFGLVDICFCGLAIKKLDIGKYTSIKAYDIRLFKEFISYGYPLIGLTLIMYVLNISDRYIIKYFFSDSEVGIYYANYTIPSSLFTLIMAGLSKGFYPKLLDHWTKDDLFSVSSSLMSAIKNYLFIGLPAASGLLLVGKDMAYLFLGQEYREGYMIIGVIAFSMFFYGLSEYFNKGYELNKKTIYITQNAFFAAILNILLNIMTIPLLGYEAAAYTTLFSFFIYALICYIRRMKNIIIKIPLIFFLKLAFSLSLMVLVIMIIKLFMSQGIGRLIVSVLSGMVVYIGAFYLTHGYITSR